MHTTDIRTEIHRVVSSICPLDKIESDNINFVLDWINSGSGLFRTEPPATPNPHLVSYFAIVTPELDRILLVDHKKAELWLPSGGHVEPNEHPQEAARREAKEELGIDAEFIFDEPIFITITNTVGNVEKHTDISLWYLFKGDPDQALEYDSNEFHQIKWFGLDKIPFEKSDPHLRRFIQKMKRLKQEPGLTTKRFRG